MDETTRITILVDNGEAPGYCSEWGLSLHVRHEHTNLLLDFGQTDAFARNASQLGIDLAHVDFAVLSHAHYDHADGMGAFFALNDHAPLYVSEACAENCWSTGGTKEPHYIGIKRGYMEQFSHRIVRIAADQPTAIAPGIHVLPHTTRGLADKGMRDGMLLRVADEWQPDAYAHEISLVLDLGTDADAPLAVLNSCSHAGPDAILGEVSLAFPQRRIAAFVGGLHLFRAGDEIIVAAANALRNAGVEHVYTGHCTGERAIELLNSELPGHITQLRPGLSFDLSR